MSEFLNQVLSDSVRPEVDVTTTTTITNYNDPNEPPKKRVRLHYRYLGTCNIEYYLLNRYNGFRLLAPISGSTRDFNFAEHLELDEVRAGLRVVTASCEGVWYLTVTCLADRKADQPVNLVAVHNISLNPNPHLGDTKKMYNTFPGCDSRWVVLAQKLFVIEGGSTSSASLKDEFGAVLNYTHPTIRWATPYNYYDLHKDHHKLYYYVAATPGALALRKTALRKSGNQEQIKVQVKHKFVFGIKV